MKFGSYLTGPFGQSQELYKARNEAKRGRGSPQAVTKQILEDTKTIIAKQEEAGLDYLIDPMFAFYYLFQPLAENVEGVEIGPQENWFNNNVFYWRPQINGPLRVGDGFSEKFTHLDLLPKDGSGMAVLPSPFTLLMLSDLSGYRDKKGAMVDLAHLLKGEAMDLVAKGIGRIQYDEPVIVHRQSLGSITPEDLQLLKWGIEICGDIEGATVSLHTYFGDAGPILPHLIDLPVECIGVDGTETNLDDILKHKFGGVELAFGLVDARNTFLEDPEELVARLRTVAEKSEPAALWFTPNTGTEYRGYSHGMNKLSILEKVRRELNG